MKRISEYDNITTVAENDVLPIVDVSDTSQATTGSTKKGTIEKIADYLKSRVETLTNKTISGSSNTITHIIPAGTISMYGGASAPTGYLLCDGQAVSRTTYADLFTAIGTTYGVGDGSTTFNVPNIKGKVPVGLNSADTSFDALGETGGEKTHTLTTTEMPSHTHTQNAHTHTQQPHSHTTNGSLAAGGFLEGLVYGNDQTPDYTGYGLNNATPVINSATATNQNTGGGGAHNNLQPYIVVNYIIKT